MSAQLGGGGVGVGDSAGSLIIQHVLHNLYSSHNSPKLNPYISFIKRYNTHLYMNYSTTLISENILETLESDIITFTC